MWRVSLALMLGGCVLSGGSRAQHNASQTQKDSPAQNAGGKPTPDVGPPAPPEPPSSGGVVGQIDDPGSQLPALPQLTNVVALQREDSVGIDFDPVDDAVDYRVYLLPAADQAQVHSDGSLTIPNAVYHCAGLRQTYDVANNLNSSVNDQYQTVPNAGLDLAIGGAAYPPVAVQVPAQPTLGYVFTTAADDRIPVYAIAIRSGGDELGWRESRTKVYTTDSAVRQAKMTGGGRDDGIVFYVPATASASTQTIYHSAQSDVGGGAYENYFGEADKSARAGDSTPPSPAFQVLAATAPGATPLMYVTYHSGGFHTELVAGKERWKRAANQGPGPLWHLEWTNIDAPVVLVVEALASGCPFQGLMAPQAVTAPPHQTLLTFEQVQSASATGEVFINGQYDVGTSSTNPKGVQNTWLTTPTTSPVPVARSFVHVAPQPHDPAAWDWYEGFRTAFGGQTPRHDTTSCVCQPADSPLPCNSGSGNCGYWTSSTLDIGAYEIDNPQGATLYASGNLLEQFWDVFSDFGEDVTASVNLTAPQTTVVDTDASKFLHVTWTVNTVGTDRRYPQMILSDQPPPVKDAFANPAANILILQTIDGPSQRLEAQAFHGLVGGRPWAVNNQAPDHAIDDYNYQMLTPADSPLEHAGMDRMTTFDAYVSSSKVYMFMDGAAAGCMQFPTDNGFALSGPVTVNFGDVLYHEGAPDEMVCYQTRPFSFLSAHQCNETVRHWDDLGFKSGVAAPLWDDSRFPCQAY